MDRAPPRITRGSCARAVHAWATRTWATGAWATLACGLDLARAWLDLTRSWARLWVFSDGLGSNPNRKYPWDHIYKKGFPGSFQGKRTVTYFFQLCSLFLSYVLGSRLDHQRVHAEATYGRELFAGIILECHLSSNIQHPIGNQRQYYLC